jgi:thiopurine S-methyltransferase
VRVVGQTSVVDPEFWVERWEVGQTAWDQAAPHPLLLEHWGSLGLAAGSGVFVPLCGASVDMVWLADQGHRVVGVDVSPLAAERFFERVGISPVTRTVGGFAVSTAGPYEFWCGDLFELPAEAVGDVAGVYDRASLVALPPDLRGRYAAHVTSLLPAAIELLLTFVYDPAEMDGPPFSVAAEEVGSLYGGEFDIELIADTDLFEREPGFAARGPTWTREQAHVLRPR